jgi:heme-degrading monooxygenase HmoA
VPATPWKTRREPEAEREYPVLLTALPMRKLSRLPRFLRYVMQIRGQLNRTDGLLGYSLLAKPLRSNYWTLSVWESNDALHRFIRESPHREAMAELPRYLSGFRTTRWTIRGNGVPPNWNDALARERDSAVGAGKNSH